MCSDESMHLTLSSQPLNFREAALSNILPLNEHVLVKHSATHHISPNKSLALVCTHPSPEKFTIAHNEFDDMFKLGIT